MIGQLKGRVIEHEVPHLILDVNGVGYEIEATLSTFEQIIADQPVLIFTHLAIRDDAHVLFGFSSKLEKTLFRALLKVNGVGAKMAINILSGMSVADFSLAVQTENVQTLVKLPGVGKKTAQRLIIEMRDRLDKLNLSEGSVNSTQIPTQLIPNAVADAISALEALGYKNNEATKMVNGIKKEGLQSDELIRSALQASISP